MLEALQFVKGAIAKKDIVPGLQHFRIDGGLIKSYNGKIALCCPIPLDLTCQPKAVNMIKAIGECKETTHLSMTPAGRLAIKSGKFKSFIDCDPSEAFPNVQPEGDLIPLPGDLLKSLKMLEPIIGEDMSRAWARGILLRGQYAFATNNVTLVQYWLGYSFPCDLVIPHDAVNELIRIGVEPTSMQVQENSVTFHFPGDKWMRTQTYSTQWPDISKVLDRENPETNVDLQSDLFDSIRSLVSFVDDTNKLFFLGDSARTHFEEGAGASVEISDLPPQACFNLKQVLLLEGIADKFNYSHLPNGPLLFFGPRLRGAIASMRYDFPEVKK